MGVTITVAAGPRPKLEQLRHRDVVELSRERVFDFTIDLTGGVEQGMFEIPVDVPGLIERFGLALADLAGTPEARDLSFERVFELCTLSIGQPALIEFNEVIRDGPEFRLTVLRWASVGWAVNVGSISTS